jgi:hypothetical protein
VYFGSYKIPGAVCYLLRAAEAGIRSAVIGMWLGVLTPRLMAKLDEWYYTRGFAGTYRDKEYNRSGFYAWEQDAIDSYFLESSTVLVAAGAGAGREMLALNRRGIEVDGYEYNPALVELGNALLAEEGWAPSLYPAPANRLPGGAKAYDGVIVGWATYTLIAGRNTRIGLLRQIRGRCKAGTPILLSFFCRTGTSPSYRLTAAIANSIRTLLRRDRVEVGDTLSVGFAHRFTEQEVAEELRAGGFEPVRFHSEPYGYVVGVAV